MSDREREDEPNDPGAEVDPREGDQAEFDQPQVQVPGVTELREAVTRRFWKRLPPRASLRQDAVAGVSLAVANVPDGMANAVLVGVNPVFGLYAAMVGPFVGGMLSSSALMVITTTAAASLTTSQALIDIAPDERGDALFLMVIMVGVLQALLGVLRLGRLTRFVSYSVTTGLLAGVSTLLILSQLPTITGYAAEGGSKVAQAADVLWNLDQAHGWSLAIGVLVLVLGVVLPRTGLRHVGRLMAVVVASLLVALIPALGGVRIVRDVGDIPEGIAAPSLPAFVALFDVITGAISVAIVILVQGVGVSQSVPNPDGGRTSVSRDFMAQGMANIFSGFFQGLPVGGSLSATALGVLSGAMSRWAPILAGVAMALVILVVPDLVELVAMPALGALLILAGAASLKPRELLSILRTGWPSRLAALTTFLCTLFLPIQAAVGIGVVLATLLYVNESGTDVRIVELVPLTDGRLAERPAPERLRSRTVTTLDVYGHLFYAGARTLEERLPSTSGAERPVVVLRLRGRTALGATLIEVLTRYAMALHEVGGRLYLAGVSPEARAQLARAGKVAATHAVRAYVATPVLGEALQQARSDAERWLATRPDETPPAAR